MIAQQGGTSGRILRRLGLSPAQCPTRDLLESTPSGPTARSAATPNLGHSRPPASARSAKGPSPAIADAAPIASIPTLSGVLLHPCVRPPGSTPEGSLPPRQQVPAYR